MLIRPADDASAQFELIGQRVLFHLAANSPVFDALAARYGTGLADPAEAHARKLRAIRDIVLDIAEVRAKFKYGGNVDAAHRAHVAAELEQRDGPGDASARAHMRH